VEIFVPAAPRTNRHRRRPQRRAEFVEKLGATVPQLLCALIHKFTVARLATDLARSTSEAE
jgi:hypothetical protein